MRLTTAVMAEHLSATKPKKIKDDAVKGFYARFSGRGSADFILRYVSPITLKEVSFVLGDYGQGLNQLSVLVARDEAKIARAEVEAGRDPHLVHRDGVKAKQSLFKERDNQNTNIEVLTDEYMEKVKKRLRKTTMLEKKRMMKRLNELVGDQLIETINRRHVIEMLEIQENTYGDNVAGKFLAHCSAFWNWAEENGKFEGNNPWSKMKERRKQYKPKPKTRWLDDDELTHLIEEQYPTHHPMIQRALLVCLYTNCRPGMATWTEESGEDGMDWSEIKWNRREWFLSDVRMKGHNEYIVPLSDQFYNLLREWWEADDRPESGPVTHAKSTAKKYLRSSVFAEDIKKSGATYTPHDLRRTVSTQLQRLKCPGDIRSELRAHVDSSNIAKVYDIYKYIDERQEWLQTWANHLDTLGFANLAMKSKQERLQIEVVGG